MVDDYIATRRGSGAPEYKRKFDIHGKLLVPVESTGNNMVGIHYLRDVKPNMREKIIHQFVSMGDILYDMALTHNLKVVEALDMRIPEYLAHNVPPPTNVKSYLELFNRLFYFGSFYLQKYPDKVVSFFDYLMFLMEHAKVMSVPELVELDHRMRIDFSCYPEWNWAQHRDENRRTIDWIVNKIRIATIKNPPVQVVAQGTFRSLQKVNPRPGPPASYTRGPVKAQSPGKVNKRGKGKVTREMVQDEVCVGWNGGNCTIKPPKECWRRHICINPACQGNHRVVDCPMMKK